ncbi:hypothetical protein RJT34_31911 [Clitoria ternatea]|uniref:Uncharacterized protein n=1 Tax=Clitoria ternatea TaxID=43366 RepID=A0AAN9EWE5_CLITE
MTPDIDGGTQVVGSKRNRVDMLVMHLSLRKLLLGLISSSHSCQRRNIREDQERENGCIQRERERKRARED